MITSLVLIISYLTVNCLFLSISVSELIVLNKEVKQSMKVAYAEGTFKNLRIQWESFLLFCFYYKLNPFPVDVETLCLYAQILSRSFISVQSVRKYLSAVKTLHSLLDLKIGGARWLSGRVSDSGARGRGSETYRRRVVPLSKTLYSPKVLVNYPGSGGSVPTWLKNCWLGR